MLNVRFQHDFDKLQARIAEIQAAATGHDKASSVDLIEAGLIVDALAISEDARPW